MIVSVRAREHSKNQAVDRLASEAAKGRTVRPMRWRSDTGSMYVRLSKPSRFSEEIGSGIGRLPDLELPPLLLKPIDTKQLFQVIELKLAGELP